MERAPKKSVAMFDLRRVALWLAVLVVPGGILLLPLLIADMRRSRGSKPNPEKPENHSDEPAPPLAA